MEHYSFIIFNILNYSDVSKIKKIKNRLRLREIDIDMLVEIFLNKFHHNCIVKIIAILKR